MMSRLVGWFALLLIGTDLFVISPLLPDITEELGVSTSAGGMTVTVFALAYLVGGPSLGAWADRRGRYPVLLIALAVFALANLATAAAPNLVVLLIARVVAGLAASGVTPSVYALVGASAPVERRAGWLAVVTSGLLLALATGAPLGSLLGAALDWRGVFVLLAVASVVMLGVIAWARPRHTSGEGAKSSGQNTATEGVPPETPSVMVRLRAVVVTGLWATAVYGLYTFLGTILRENAGFSPDAVALALVCCGLGALLGNLVGGWLADRCGGRIVSVFTLLVLAGVEIGVGVTIDAATPVLLTMLGLTALAAYPFFSAQQARLMAAFPNTSGSLIAWNNSAMYAGILLGSVIGGPVLTAWNASVLAYAAAATAVLAAATAAFSISHRTPEPATP